MAAALAGGAGGGGGISGGDASSKLQSSATGTSGTGQKNINIGGNPNVAVGIAALAKSPLLVVGVVGAIFLYLHFKGKL